jgi:hypothetical protein
VPSAAGNGAGALARRVAAGVSPGRAARLAAVLAECVRDPAGYEASVRGAAGSAPSAGRMMVERASPDVLDTIAASLDVRLPPFTTHWLDLAARAGVPLIAGWDLRGGGETRCVKLYVNASDAARATRERLATALAPGVARREAPAVVGVNVRADGVIETKLYMQSADAPALAESLGERARSLAAAARSEGADAGAVLSYDAVDGRLQARAFFVALREPHDAEGWRCVRSLPGYDERTIESLLPFAPAPPRSLGVSLASSLAPRPSSPQWTLYFKPRASGPAPEALEPVAIFRGGGVEVGVFVEPTEHAARAFRRTERHAISVRVRDGEPAPGALESLVDWFTARVRDGEEDGRRPLGARLTDPPPPWHAVGETGPAGGAREGS